MGNSTLTFVAAALIVLGAFGASIGQEESKPALAGDKGSTPETVIEIMHLAESKLYSPLRDGLEDLAFVQQIALNKQIRTYWFKAPDMTRAIHGRPVKADPEKQKKIHKLLRQREVNTPVPQIVADRTMGLMLGKPLTCLLPYGTFEIVKKDEAGTQLRFTVNITNPKDLVWSHIDFFLDADFLLTKYMEKMTYDGRIEEHAVTMKPYKKETKLLVFDTDFIIAGSVKFQKRVNLKYEYGEVEGFWFPVKIDMRVDEEGKLYTERFLDYKINQGIDEKEFKKQD